MLIPQELEAATTAMNPCQLERRAACEVMALCSLDPIYRQMAENTAAHALYWPQNAWDEEHLNQYRQHYLGLLVRSNPDTFDLEAV